MKTISFNTCFILVTLLFAIESTEIYAQGVDNLRIQREKLLKDIENTKKLLVTKKTSIDETVNQVNLLTLELKVREEIIANYKKEIEVVSSKIEKNQKSINSLEKNIDEIKKEYVKLIQDTYLRRSSMSDLLYLLSANDFSEAYRRHRLVKEYSSYRQKQAQTLINQQNDLKILQIDTKTQRESKEQTLKNLEKEYTALNITQGQKNKLVGDLRKEEKSLKNKIAENEKRAKTLENQIMQYIRQSQNTKSEYGKDFKSSMGKLIWPVSKGIVVNDFGVHEHPVIKGIIIENNGIDIKSIENDDVVSVYPGEISRVINFPGSNNAIIIRHGEYLTIYSNLREIFVRQGQKVNTGEKLGKVYKEKNETFGVLHFEIRKDGGEKLNPTKWLKP